MKATYIYILMGLAMLSACTQDEKLAAIDDGDIIQVGGVSTSAMTLTTTVTRAAEEDASTPDWLKEVLKSSGVALSYYKTADAKQQVTLKQEGDDNYSLKNAEGIPAKWLGNGAHVFEGVYVPEDLQTSGAHTYDNLSRYTATPPSTKIAATVGRITIPLQHRLARVVAYVLIEPGMGATLKGYSKENDDSNKDVANTMLRFCNVQTLDYVNAQNQPVWKSERKAIPNYLGVKTVTLYKDAATGKLIFPEDDEYATAEGNSSYTPLEYGACPYYDLVVRPTYQPRTEGTNVMFDESEGNATDAVENKIDFELTLNNDLEYEKTFKFDLNANDETVVYLRVTPERIDYNSAGARLWKESVYHDDYYGVDNSGYSLSTAGSSWQRAYTNSDTDYPITDGETYKDHQYVSDTDWIKMFSQATENGAHHGDYFILESDITIDTDLLPDNFVFTGHLDGLDHTITLTGSRGHLFAGLNGIYSTLQEEGQTATWQANVHKEGETWVPIKGYRAEVLNTTIAGGTLFEEHAEITGYVNNCK